MHDAAIARAIRALLDAREGSICPSDVARELATDEKAWRALMPRIREVAAAADPASRTFLVKADVPAGAAELGQTATVHVELAPADGKLRLPLQAVAGEGDRSHVWILDKATMKVREQPVVVLRPEGDNLVLDSGLKPGDTVVTAGAHALSPDEQVSLYVEPSKR